MTEGSRGQPRSPAPPGEAAGPCPARQSSGLHLPAPVPRAKERKAFATLTSCVFGLFASVNQGFCLDAEVALATGQLLAPNSHQSSSAASHGSESRGETPCSLNEDDEEDEEEDSSSPE